MSKRIKFRTYHTDDKRRCVVCYKKIDAASGIVGEGPSPGDFTLCLYCGTVYKFDDKLKMIKLSELEIIYRQN